MTSPDSGALAAALEDAPLTVFSIDGVGRLTVLAGQELELLGLSAADLAQRSPADAPIIGPLVREARREGRARQVVEVGGRTYDVTLRAGAAGHVHGSAVDVTDWHSEGRDLAHAASHDQLTGLPNRGLLRDRLEMAVSRLGRAGGAVAVLFIDLDHFKSVNDDLGHDAGDRLLVAAARRLAAVIRPGDTVARYSGDEFVVVCELSGDGGRDAAVVAERIVSAFRLPFLVEGRDVRSSASVGVGLTTDPGADVEGVLREADQRMYEAKSGGRSRWEA